MKKKKKWLLFLIIAFPSLFWLILETSTINSRRMPFYGPKKVVSAGDTIFYQPPLTPALRDSVFAKAEGSSAMHMLMFMKRSYGNDSYRIAGLWEYLHYKRKKLTGIPVVIITERNIFTGDAAEMTKLQNVKGVYFYEADSTEFEKLNKAYFKHKPYYVDYSFFVMVDAGRHIRGYYDARYLDEMKRMIEEFRHLRLKEEKQKVTNANEIEQRS